MKGLSYRTRELRKGSKQGKGGRNSKASWASGSCESGSWLREYCGHAHTEGCRTGKFLGGY